jgi:GTP pyrophosphokinase
VRAWFNEQLRHETEARGRELVERLLQREGRTAIKLEDLASQLGFKSAEDLFFVVGKDEFSLRSIEQLLHPHAPLPSEDEVLAKKLRAGSPARSPKGGVLVVGVDSLMTQLAKCCKPAPPDPICGFVTRGKGVSIHRNDCPMFLRMAARAPERVLQTAWSAEVLGGRGASVYPVDIAIEAQDRQGLLRDISEVFAREKVNVVGVKSQSRRETAFMQFTVEVSNSTQVQRACALLGEVAGVVRASRKS